MRMYAIVISKRYKTTLKRIARHKHFDRSLLEKVIADIAAGKPLAPKYRDHQLTGTLKDFRECHIKNDLLLLYRIHHDELVLLLIAIGSHSELFE